MQRLMFVTWCGLVFCSANADERRAKPIVGTDQTTGVGAKQAAKVQIEECRIVLIKQVTLACDRSGVLKSVPFQEGERVEAKSQVALIHDEVAKASLAVARQKAKSDVDVQFNKAARDSADLEYRKSVKANEDSAKKNIVAVAQNEIEKLKLVLTKSVFAIEQAENELLLNQLSAEQAQAELETFSVIAPFDGVVARVFKHVGEAVRQGDPIVELVNVDRVRIEARVGLGEIRSVKLKQRVKVRLVDPEFTLPEESEEFWGEVMFVDLTVDPVSRETRVWAEVDNRDNILRAGLLAEMVIDVEPMSPSEIRVRK